MGLPLYQIKRDQLIISRFKLQGLNLAFSLDQHNILRVCLKIFDWSKMAPFRLSFVTKMLIMRCITPLFAPRLDENVLIFAYNPKFKHPLSLFPKNQKYAKTGLSAQL
jgi:hypothetical protein